MSLQQITANDIISVSNTVIIGTTLPGPGQVNMIMLDSGNSTGNGAVTVPRGNTAQRPSNPTIGMVRYNTDTAVLENYTSQGWLKVSVPIPIISSISGTIYAGNTSTITINGSNFEPTQGTISFQVSGNSAIQVSATPNAGGTQVSCLVPSGIYLSPAGSVVNITYTNSDNGVSGPYSMTSIALPTGGTITSSGSYRYHAFTSSGTFAVSQSTNIELLMVAGGGGTGDANGGAGGGAGGLIYQASVTVTGSNGVTIGGGGSAVNGGYNSPRGGNGTNTSFLTYTAIGGGGSGTEGYSASNGTSSGAGYGASGGSGGGSVRTNATGVGGRGTSGQGNNGGSNYPDGAPHYAGGGGGGAGAVGSDGNSGGAGSGGAGLQYSQFSSWGYPSGWFAGGGGAGYYNNSTGGSGASGGNGGGGPGGSQISQSAKNGVSNTGGGGGAHGLANNLGGNGGSGIVLIRYQIV